MYTSNIVTISYTLMKLAWKHNYFKKITTYRINHVRKVELRLTGIAGFGFLWPKFSTKNNKKEDITVVLEKADMEFDNGHYEDCYHSLKISKFQDNTEVKWRICRALYNMAKDTKHDQNYRKDLIKQAYEIIINEINTPQENYAVHKWYALVLDAKANYDGHRERIKQLEKIKEHMDLAVRLNPNDATTLHMLGEWCYQLSEMPWHQRKTAELLFCSLPTSSYEDALDYFLKAESVQPRFYSINLLRLGNCYLKLKKEDQAKYYLQLAASYPAKSNEDHKANKEATELLKKLK